MRHCENGHEKIRVHLGRTTNTGIPRGVEGMNIITFTVLGEPQGKGRPKFSKVGNFTRARTPDQTVIYENLIKTEYRRQCGENGFSDGAMLELYVKAYYKIPASASKKKKQAMLSGELRPTKKPDLDNVLKVVADSLNLIAYRDDAQIVETRAQKYYAEQPRVEVEILEIER